MDLPPPVWFAAEPFEVVGCRSVDGEGSTRGWLSNRRAAEPCKVVVSCIITTRTSRRSSSMSGLKSKALVDEVEFGAAEESGKTWSC
jgi:hypothetical protein